MSPADGSSHWGYVDYERLGDETSVDATVYVRMCRPDFSACGVIAANSQVVTTVEDGPFNFGFVETSRKPTSFGHIYQACASVYVEETGFHYVNVCSPYMT